MNISGTGKTGGGVNNVNVNAEGQLETRSIVASEVEHSVMEGGNFQIYTGVINLSTANRTAVLYVKNNDTTDLFLTGVTVGTSASSGGANNQILLESVGNITAADAIVTGGTDKIAFNTNGGSADQFSGVIKQGDGSTAAAANGVAVSGALGDFTRASNFQLNTIVPKGGSAGIEVTPPAGNTSMDLVITLTFHKVEVL